MKKSLLALAVAAAVSPAAFAQTNVTLYGIADVGVSADRGSIGSATLAPVPGAAGVGSNSTAVRVNSGYMSTSRFGITGTEDLGAGLRGVFTLELGYAGDTGAFTTYRGNPGGATPTAQGTAGTPGSTNAQGTLIGAGFNRRSFVGLQGGFGTIALGRDYTPFFWAQLATDNLGYGLYGNLLNSTQLSGTGSEVFLRASNAVFYTSPKFGGLTLRAFGSAGSESFGGTGASALPRTANQMYGIGAEYGAGPLTVAGAYQEARLPTINAAGAFTNDTDRRKDWVVGAKYNFGLFSLGAGYAQVDPVNVATVGAVNNNKQYWLGGSIGIGKGSILVQWNRITQDRFNFADGRADTASISYTYPFSRRTTAYATLGYVRNNAQSNIGLFASDNSVAAGGFGADPRGVALGVRHSF